MYEKIIWIHSLHEFIYELIYVNSYKCEFKGSWFICVFMYMNNYYEEYREFIPEIMGTKVPDV